MDIDEVVIPAPTKTARDASILVLFAWPGDTIRRRQLIALLQGDKGVLEVSSPYSGVVKEVQVKVGTRVTAGSPILTLDRIEPRSRQRVVGGEHSHYLPALPVRQGSGNLPLSTAPTLTAFQRQIESVLGGALTAPATLAVADFWAHRKAFSQGLASKNLTVQVVLESAPPDQAGPAAGYYQSLQRLAHPLVLAGLLLMFFLWQAAIALFALGVALYFGAGYLGARNNDHGHRPIVQPMEHSLCETVMAKLCARYILGMVAFTSNTGRAQWPDYPSCVLTGKRVHIAGVEPRTRP